jgi:hypothetical protein
MSAANRGDGDILTNLRFALLMAGYGLYGVRGTMRNEASLMFLSKV